MEVDYSPGPLGRLKTATPQGGPLTEINGCWPEKGEDVGGLPTTPPDPNSATGDDCLQRELRRPQALPVKLSDCQRMGSILPLHAPNFPSSRRRARHG